MNKYKGQVEAHTRITHLITPDSNYEMAFETFKSYWNDGYDPEVGRDTCLSKPSSIKESAIGRIHLRPVYFTGDEGEVYGYSATEKCWDKWEDTQEVPSVQSSTSDIPTSNEWIVYCVDDNRNACMLAYLDEGMDPHTYCEDMANMERFIAMADEWFKEKSAFPMSKEEFPLAFDDKWLES